MLAECGSNQVNTGSVSVHSSRSSTLKLKDALVKNPTLLWAGLGGLRAPEALLPALCPGAHWLN